MWRTKPPLSEAAARAIEKKLGFALPAGYRAFVREIGDGGEGFGAEIPLQTLAKLSASDPYAFVELTKGAVAQKFDKGECGYGRHVAESEGPFSLTVWGLGPWASYGYAGEMGSRPANDAPLPGVH